MSWRDRAKRLRDEHTSAVGSVIKVDHVPGRFVLTFDDGPDPVGTPAVLQVLAERQATATFFVLLGRVRRQRALLNEVLAAGHEVALHGIDHRALPTLSVAEVRTRSRDGKAELEDAVGHSVHWMRPPYGRQTPRTWWQTRRAGLMPVLWGPSNWDSRPRATHAERVEHAMVGAQAGAIMLCHDGFAGPDDGVDDGPAPVLDRGRLLTDVLDRYDELGLRAVSLRDALVTGTAVRAARFRR